MAGTAEKLEATLKKLKGLDNILAEPAKARVEAAKFQRLHREEADRSKRLKAVVRKQERRIRELEREAGTEKPTTTTVGPPELSPGIHEVDPDLFS